MDRPRRHCGCKWLGVGAIVSWRARPRFCRARSDDPASNLGHEYHLSLHLGKRHQQAHDASGDAGRPPHAHARRLRIRLWRRRCSVGSAGDQAAEPARRTDPRASLASTARSAGSRSGTRSSLQALPGSIRPPTRRPFAQTLHIGPASGRTRLTRKVRGRHTPPALHGGSCRARGKRAPGVCRPT